MEKNYEALQSLEEISRLSFEIQIIYSKLTLLEISKDITDDYESQKKTLLDQLALLLEDEKEAYKPFEEDFYLAEEAIEFLQKNTKENVPEKFRLVQKRIIKKLESFALQGAIDNEDEEYLESYLEEEFFSDLFLDKGYSIQDIIPLIEDLSLPIEISLRRQFVQTLNEAIKNPCNFDIKRLLINAKYDFIYETSGSIEQECLSQRFNYNLKCNLKEETTLPGIDTHIKSSYFKKHIKNKLLDMLIVCGSCTELDMAISEIDWFKTYLLYLSDSDVEEIKTRLDGHYFQNDDIKDILLKAIKDINLLRTIHSSSKQKSAS